MGRKKPWSDLHKILHWGDVLDVITITDANFEDDRLRRFCVVRGQILGFSMVLSLSLQHKMEREGRGKTGGKGRK